MLLFSIKEKKDKISLQKQQKNKRMKLKQAKGGSKPKKEVKADE